MILGSGTTLATFAAGIDATRAQLAILNPLLVSRYPQTAELYRWLSLLEGLVDAAENQPRLDACLCILLDGTAGATGRHGRADGGTAGTDSGHFRAEKARAVSVQDPLAGGCPSGTPGGQMLSQGPGRRGAGHFCAACWAEGPGGRWGHRGRCGGAKVALVTDVAGQAATAGPADPQGRLPAVPFHGIHQAGILPPPARQMAMLSFDVTAASRDELSELLQTLTQRARFLTAGGAPVPAGVTGPPTDSGILGAPVVPGRADSNRRRGYIAVRRPLWARVA